MQLFCRRALNSSLFLLSVFILFPVDEKCFAKEDMLDEVFAYDAKECEIRRRDAIITGQLKSEKGIF